MDLGSVERGLDTLEGTAPERTSIWWTLPRQALPPVAAIALLLAVWEAFVLAGFQPTYRVPGPADVWASLVQHWHDGLVQTAIVNSVHRGALGFLLAVAIATPLGLIVARVPFVRTAVGPILSGLQSLPSVAWVAAALIWFGLSDAAIYAVVLLGAVPSIANGLVAGIDQIPPLYLRVGKVLGAHGLSGVRHVLLPAALPGYVAGLRQGWAFAWRSLMAAELITISKDIGPGLGQFLNLGREQIDMSWVMLGIILILIVGVAIELLVFGPLERRVLHARGLAAVAR
ncbi:MAG: ABC transporter permease [Candidatus Dormiibacterota bacterium]